MRRYAPLQFIIEPRTIGPARDACVIDTIHEHTMRGQEARAAHNYIVGIGHYAVIENYEHATAWERLVAKTEKEKMIAQLLAARVPHAQTQQTPDFEFMQHQPSHGLTPSQGYTDLPSPELIPAQAPAPARTLARLTPQPTIKKAGRKKKETLDPLQTRLPFRSVKKR